MQEIHPATIRLAFPVNRPGTGETLLILGLLLLMGTTIIPVALGGGADGDANPVRLARYGYIAIYAIGLLMIFWRGRALARFANTSPLLALLLLLPFFSMLWSVNPSESFQRGVAVLCPSLIGIYMAERFDLRTIILMLAGAYALVAIVDFITAAGVPSIGRMNDAEWHGAWRGFHGHKTALGKAASVGALFSLYAIMIARGHLRMAFAAVCGVQFILLLQAHSLASILSLCMALAFMALLFAAKQRSKALLWIYSAGVILVACTLALFLGGNGLGSLLELLGKNETMSSRLPLWNEALISIAKAPWLGYGFSGFWQSDLPDIQRIRAALRFEPHYAHNGLLEMLLDGGLLFVALFTAHILSFGAKASRLFSQGAFHASLPLLFLFVFILSNFAEASVLPKNSLFWVAFVAIAAFTARAVRFTSQSAAVPLPRRFSGAVE